MRGFDRNLLAIACGLLVIVGLMTGGGSGVTQSLLVDTNDTATAQFNLADEGGRVGDTRVFTGTDSCRDARGCSEKKRPSGSTPVATSRGIDPTSTHNVTTPNNETATPVGTAGSNETTAVSPTEAPPSTTTTATVTGTESETPTSTESTSPTETTEAPTTDASTPTETEEERSAQTTAAPSTEPSTETQADNSTEA